MSGFRRDGPARIKQFPIDRIALRRFSDDPSPLSFWQPSLECLLQAVQHTDTFLIPGTKRSINFGSDVTFLLCHEQVVYGFCSLTSAPIDSLDFVAYVTVVILFGQLCRRTVGRATNLRSDLVLLLIWPLMAQVTNLNVEPGKAFDRLPNPQRPSMISCSS